MRHRIFTTTLACIAASLAASAAHAQEGMRGAAYATRAELESTAVMRATQAADAKRSATDRAQAAEDEKQLRDRLAQGDFHVGDRIVVRITGGQSALDTLTVTPARSVRIPDAGDFSVEGVLRSELDERLNAQLARYFRNASVHTQPLTRLAVLGEVRTPGFVHVPSQSLLSDVISAAGGPTPAGRLDRASVRRAGRTVITAGAFAKGLAAGATLDDFGIRAGDEVVVGGKRTTNWSQIIQTATLVVGSAATIIAIQHR
jgi:protein involved in polysaccharide export with SLBB domain